MGYLQSLRSYVPISMVDVEMLVTSEFPVIEASKHTIALPKISYISKMFVAYIEAFVGAAPYFKTTDPRMKLDARFTKAMSEFNKQEDLRFDQYVAHKLRSQFPPTQWFVGPGGTDDTGTGGGAGEEGEKEDNEEAIAL